MSLRVLRRNMHVAMPWRNGGGTTLEVMSWPPGCALSNFDWRVSFARVEGSGPFSRFPGVDRVITLVEGDQLVLSVRDVGVALGPFTPFRFAGEDEVTSSVLGPITDLNVMTKRGRLRADVATHRVGDAVLEVEPAPDAVESLVAVLDGEVTVVTTRGASVGLKPLDVIAGYCAPLALSGLGVVEVISVLADDS